MAAPLISIVFLIQFPRRTMHVLISARPSYLGVASEVNSMGIPAVPFSGLALLALTAAISITVPLFILNAMIFVPLGQIVGGYLEGAPRGIFAYSVNVLGGLGGILLFHNKYHAQIIAKRSFSSESYVVAFRITLRRVIPDMLPTTNYSATKAVFVEPMPACKLKCCGSMPTPASPVRTLLAPPLMAAASSTSSQFKSFLAACAM
jgi:hypothetical protein